MGLVDEDTIESILALYRSVPKVRDVPKIVEKVAVETAQYPHHIILEQKQEKVHPLNKVEVVKDTFGVPLNNEIAVNLVNEVPIKYTDHIEKPLIYTNTRDRPVNTLVEKTFAEQREAYVDRIEERDKAVHIVEDKPVYNKDIVEIQVEKIAHHTVVEEVIKPVELIVEKIV